MKRYSRIGAMAAAVVLVAAACGSDDGGSNDGTPSPTASAGDTTTPSSGSADKTEVVIGFVAPLTSGNATYAMQMLNSAKLAADEVNASDGPVEFVIKEYDDKGTAQDAAAVAQRAITVDGAKVIVGGYTGAESVAIKEVTERNKVVYVSTSSAHPDIVKDVTYAFRVAAASDRQVPGWISLIEKLGSTSPGVLHDDSPTPAAAAPKLVDELEKSGITPCTDAISYPINSTDVTAQVQQIKAAGCDALFALAASAADAGSIVKSMAEQDLVVPAIGYVPLASADAFKVAGDAYDAIPVYTIFNRSETKPEYVAFSEAYQVAHPTTDPIGESANMTYDAIHFLAVALAANGVDGSGDALATALHEMGPYTGATGTVDINFGDGFDAFPDAVFVPYQVVDHTAVEVK